MLVKMGIPAELDILKENVNQKIVSVDIPHLKYTLGAWCRDDGIFDDHIMYYYFYKNYHPNNDIRNCEVEKNPMIQTDDRDDEYVSSFFERILGNLTSRRFGKIWDFEEQCLLYCNTTFTHNPYDAVLKNVFCQHIQRRLGSVIIPGHRFGVIANEKRPWSKTILDGYNLESDRIVNIEYGFDDYEDFIVDYQPYLQRQLMITGADCLELYYFKLNIDYEELLNLNQSLSKSYFPKDHRSHELYGAGSLSVIPNKYRFLCKHVLFDWIASESEDKVAIIDSDQNAMDYMGELEHQLWLGLKETEPSYYYDIFSLEKIRRRRTALRMSDDLINALDLIG